MDSERIIAEGLLAQYLLGALGEEQVLQVEAALKGDPSLRAKYGEMEADFERIAFENAIAPPEEVKASLQMAVEKKYTSLETAVKQLNEEKTSYNNGRLLAAASLAALFALTSLWMYNRWQNSKQAFQQLEEQTTVLQKKTLLLENDIKVSEERLKKVSDTNVTPLLLVGNKISPDSKAVAYVNHTTKEVVVNGQGLATLSSEEAYQMWADVAGEMINMGLVPTDQDLVALEYIEGAESINITIEPAGGSEHPTVERLISSTVL